LAPQVEIRDRQALAVERLGEADLDTIAATEIPDEFSHFDTELES